MKANILDNLKINSDKEVFDTLFKNDDIIIERISSYGNTTNPDEWYDQEKDEWVILLEGVAKLEFEDKKIVELQKGDYIYLPAHQKHKVLYTSIEPNCIWLAFHFKSS